MNAVSCRNLRVLTSIVQHTTWLYARCNVSLRDVQELMDERGVEVSYEMFADGWRGSVCKSRGACDMDVHEFNRNSIRTRCSRFLSRNDGIARLR